MRIAVCVKRVPDMDVRFKIAANGASVDEAGLKYDMNDFDSWAVEAALQIKDTVIAERERQLFLQGSHQYDVRRLNLPLYPPSGTPYPKGGTYGNEVCLPIPAVETQNNPNFSST